MLPMRFVVFTSIKAKHVIGAWFPRPKQSGLHAAFPHVLKGPYSTAAGAKHVMKQRRIAGMIIKHRTHKFWTSALLEEFSLRLLVLLSAALPRASQKVTAVVSFIVSLWLDAVACGQVYLSH